MTLPYERTRAVVQTREFLVELSRNTDLTEAIRLEAKRLLRHFPSKADVLLAGRLMKRREARSSSPFSAPQRTLEALRSPVSIANAECLKLARHYLDTAVFSGGSGYETDP